ncbi:MAG: hypothetical protein ACOYT9_01895 [Patescibacteria group bacterium]|jgi:hypothetical protein
MNVKFKTEDGTKVGSGKYPRNKLPQVGSTVTLKSVGYKVLRHGDEMPKGTITIYVK